MTEVSGVNFFVFINLWLVNYNYFFYFYRIRINYVQKLKYLCIQLPNILNMEHILKRESNLDHGDHQDLRRYELNTSVSEDDNMEIDEELRNTSTISVNDSLVKNELSNVDSHIEHIDVGNIKKENVIDFSSEIILPQASQSHNINPPKVKKEIKSKKEIEEEEREKMQ